MTDREIITTTISTALIGAVLGIFAALALAGCVRHGVTLCAPGTTCCQHVVAVDLDALARSTSGLRQVTLVPAPTATPASARPTLHNEPLTYSQLMELGDALDPPTITERLERIEQGQEDMEP